MASIEPKPEWVRLAEQSQTQPSLTAGTESFFILLGGVAALFLLARSKK
jgi:hypothetical protein